MTNEELFNVLVNGFVGSWAAGINCYLDEKKPISYGVQCVIKSLNDNNTDIVRVNVYNGKKGVRIVIQGEDSPMLELANRAMPTGIVTESILQEWRSIYV